MVEGGDCGGLEAAPGLGSRGVRGPPSGPPAGPGAAEEERSGGRSGEAGGPLLMLLLLSSLLVAAVVAPAAAAAALAGGGPLSRGGSAGAGLALSVGAAGGRSADWGLGEASAAEDGASSGGGHTGGRRRQRRGYDGLKVDSDRDINSIYCFQ